MAAAWLTHAALETFDHAVIFAHWHLIPGTFLLPFKIMAVNNY